MCSFVMGYSFTCSHLRLSILWIAEWWKACRQFLFFQIRSRILLPIVGCLRGWKYISNIWHVFPCPCSWRNVSWCPFGRRLCLFSLPFWCPWLGLSFLLIQDIWKCGWNGCYWYHCSAWYLVGPWHFVSLLSLVLLEKTLLPFLIFVFQIWCGFLILLTVYVLWCCSLFLHLFLLGKFLQLLGSWVAPFPLYRVISFVWCHIEKLVSGLFQYCWIRLVRNSRPSLGRFFIMSVDKPDMPGALLFCIQAVAAFISSWLSGLARAWLTSSFCCIYSNTVRLIFTALLKTFW